MINIKNIVKYIMRIIPDKAYIRVQYYYHMKKKLNLKAPQTFNEKIQWLKLNNRNSLYTDYVDKYKVREFVESKIGSDYLIPLLAVYNDVKEIKWNDLPKEFVLKCTHGSSSNFICKDKSNASRALVLNKLQGWMKMNWYWHGREWPYKNIRPKIICEKYMVDESNNELKDYKFFCFHGEPQFVQIDYGRFDEHKRNIYDMDWNYCNAMIHYPTDREHKIPKPINFDQMISIARILSADIPHVRIDLYNINGDIYFGEMTFYHGSGYETFQPVEFEYEIGSWLDLSRVNKINT
ncbi:ATP-grasp fold amidoligase family protein [Paenibacillus sp. CAU 1782]